MTAKFCNLNVIFWFLKFVIRRNLIFDHQISGQLGNEVLKRQNLSFILLTGFRNGFLDNFMGYFDTNYLFTCGF